MYDVYVACTGIATRVLSHVPFFYNGSLGLHACGGGLVCSGGGAGGLVFMCHASNRSPKLRRAPGCIEVEFIMLKLSSVALLELGTSSCAHSLLSQQPGHTVPGHQP